ncbi:MAG: hypothetical protein HXX16_18735 [Bacteroidales bacterium]|nr:hypothetical protein [Bacteroidales bacterium]
MMNIIASILKYLIITSLCIIIGCTEKSNILTIHPKGNIYSVSVFKNTAIFSTGTKAEKNSKRIYYSNLDKDKPVLFFEVADKSKNVMPVRLYDEQVVWVEYGLEEGSPMAWKLCTKGLFDTVAPKIVMHNIKNPNVEFPHFDISGNLIILDFFTPSGTDTIDSPLILFDINKNLTKVIKAPKGYDSYTPSFNGADMNEIVCNLISLDADKKIFSKIALYQISQGKWTILDIPNSGFQPALYGKKLVYKECSSPYEYGTIQLFDLQTQCKTVLSTNPAGGESPQINQNYVVWESPSFDKVPAYNLATNKQVDLEVGKIGKPYLKGNSLIWVFEEKPDKAVMHAMFLE